MFLKVVILGGVGVIHVCASTRGLRDACSEFILAVSSLLLCISGRELGCSTKSQEGLLDTRVINFFQGPCGVCMNLNAADWAAALSTFFKI